MNYFLIFFRFLLLNIVFIGGFKLVELSASTMIYQLPKESNIMQPTESHWVIKNLERLFTNEQTRIDFMTAQEAHKYLSDYVYKQYGKEKGQQLIDHYFNNNYFGYKEKEIKEKTPSEIAEADPYLFGHISNMLFSGSPGREGSMEKAKERWYPETHFLTPKQVFDAFVQHPIYAFRIPIHDFEKYKKEFPEQAEAIFSSKYFGIPENPTERKEYFLHNPIGFFTPQLVKDIYETAKKILKTSQSGDYIVIFGNTPYFVGRALKKIIAAYPNDNTIFRHIIEFPFSGAPNRIRLMNFPNLKDIVTAERLEHLKKRLAAAGLTPENKNLLNNHWVYFVDVVASGAGLAYVIEELLREFKKQNVNPPNFNIITLNKIDINNEQDIRNAQISAINANDGEHTFFFFPSRDEIHFRISAEVAYLEDHRLLDQLPSNQWRVFPEYNAAFWQPEYDYLLSLPQTKTKLIKTVFEYFDTNIDHLIEQDKQKK